MRNAGICLAVAGLLAGGLSQAADSQMESGSRCAQIPDSLQRLVCYDRIFKAEPAAPAATVAPRATSPMPAVAVVPAAPASLGDEIVQRKTRDKAKPAEPASLDAAIAALKETRPNVFRLTLDNGQVWQQMDMSSVFQVTVGDTVRVERSAMGGFRLVRTSRGRGGWVRVTRIQ